MVRKNKSPFLCSLYSRNSYTKAEVSSLLQVPVENLYPFHMLLIHRLRRKMTWEWSPLFRSVLLTLQEIFNNLSTLDLRLEHFSSDLWSPRVCAEAGRVFSSERGRPLPTGGVSSLSSQLDLFPKNIINSIRTGRIPVQALCPSLEDSDNLVQTMLHQVRS